MGSSYKTSSLAIFYRLFSRCEMCNGRFPDTELIETDGINPGQISERYILHGACRQKRLAKPTRRQSAIQLAFIVNGHSHL